MSPIHVKKSRAPSGIKPIPRPSALRIGVVLDSSGSMYSVKDAVIRAMNANVGRIKGEAHGGGIPTFLSMATFDDDVHESLFDQVSVAQVDEIDPKSYEPQGSTALYDAIASMVSDLERGREKGEKTTYLLLVFTDGGENASDMSEAAIQSLVKSRIATDMWSFVFCVPPGAGAEIQNRFGVGPGCVREWQATEQGVREMSDDVSTGISTYYCAIRSGATNVNKAGFFAPKVDGLTATALRKGGAKELTSQFHVWDVRSDSRIDDFVRGRGVAYVPGNGMYQLTKRVKVQDYKGIAVMDNNSGKIYGGPDVRHVLGIPEGGTIELNPAAHPRFSVFVTSNSLNRKLYSGTKMLYRK